MIFKIVEKFLIFQYSIHSKTFKYLSHLLHLHNFQSKDLSPKLRMKFLLKQFPLTPLPPLLSIT